MTIVCYFLLANFLIIQRNEMITSQFEIFFIYALAFIAIIYSLSNYFLNLFKPTVIPRQTKLFLRDADYMKRFDHLSLEPEVLDCHLEHELSVAHLQSFYANENEYEQMFYNINPSFWIQFIFSCKEYFRYVHQLYSSQVDLILFDMLHMLFLSNEFKNLFNFFEYIREHQLIQLQISTRLNSFQSKPIDQTASADQFIHNTIILTVAAGFINMLPLWSKINNLYFIIWNLPNYWYIQKNKYNGLALEMCIKKHYFSELTSIMHGKSQYISWWNSSSADTVMLKRNCSHCKKRETHESQFLICVDCIEQSYPTVHYYCSRGCKNCNWESIHMIQHLEFELGVF